MPKRNIKRDKKNGNDSVIQIKNNQKLSLNKIKEIVANSTPVSIHYDKQEKRRNRIEYRTTEVFLLPSNLMNEHEYARCVVKVYRLTYIFNTKEKEWKTREEISFYISTVTYEAKTMAKIIRNQWSIENSNNYIKDTFLKEDLSRIRVNPGIMSRMRSFALNVLRINKVNNFKQTIYKNSLDLKQVLQLNYLY